ncbi:hypothetical protein HK103_005624 [Boothiomyces macroporosus]|uniref:CAP-Gly domain-containing protein n=1 Tax=Boothiomyces macroporosus TaxID=261099 RepID=A0AAD5Y7B3_9FUNG|nr:hypothetical protein HK103_005624 [Boothiomyces macroporosus]
MLQNENHILTLFVKSQNASSERRFEKSLSILELKEKLTAITGVPSSTMVLTCNGTKLQDDKQLGYYSIENYSTLVVANTEKTFDYNDLNKVEKFEISNEEYEKRNDSVLAFKKRNKIGRFAENIKDFKEEAEKIKVGDRCMVEVDGMEKRGEVKYVGLVDFKHGYFVGVQYDEPVGKHNGTVEGKSYFTCPNKHGVFLRPDIVNVGDYPEEDLFEDEF